MSEVQELMEEHPEPRRPGRPPNAARGTQRGAVRQERLRRRPVNFDKFYVDPTKIPSHMSYEFKRQFYLGKEDRRHQIDQEMNHWKPVPADRHPEIATEDPEGRIVMVGGQILMERPSYLTEEARQEDADVARAQRKEQMERLKQEKYGSSFDRVGAKTNRTYEQYIPDDE